MGVMAVISVSFFVGAAFLGYYWTQYLTSLMALIFIFSVLITKKFPGLLSAEIMTILVISAAISSYYILAKTFYGEISPSSIGNVVTRNNNFSMISLMFLLYILSSRKILSKEQWGRLVGVFLALASVGFTAFHPELKQLSSPIVKNVIDIAFVAGDGGIVVISVAAIVRNRFSMLA